MTASQIENAFYDAYGPRWVSTIYGAVNEYKVLLELAPEFQADPTRAVDAVLQGRERNSAVVPLDTLATLKQQVGPQTVNHYGQLPAVTVSFGLAPGASLGDVLTRVKKLTDSTLPQGVTGEFQGAAAAFEGALSNLAVLLVIAVLVVYIVLGILYESYIHPLTILSGLPSAGVRRAVDADRVPDGSEHLRLRRHDHADRHRREERHHADRLRARGGAQRACRPNRPSTRAA